MSLEIVNRTNQDLVVPLIHEGKRVLRNVPKKHTMFYSDAEETPELKAMASSKHLKSKFSYRVIRD